MRRPAAWRLRERILNPLRRRVGRLLTHLPRLKEFLKRIESRVAATGAALTPFVDAGAPSPVISSRSAARVARDLRRALEKRGAGPTGEVR